MKLAILIVLLCCTNGCATAAVSGWSRDSVELRGVAGIVQLNAGAGSGRALVITYDGALPGEQAFFLIPLENDGRPKPPFRYTGHAKTRDEFWGGIDVSQTAAVARMAAPVHDGPVPSHTVPPRPATNPAYVAMTPAIVAKYAGYPVAQDIVDPVRPNSLCSGASQTDGIAAVAYRIGTNGEPMMVPVFHFLMTVDSNSTMGYETCDDPLAANAFIVLIPAQLPRTEFARNSAAVWTVIATPFAVAWDIAILPVSIPAAINQFYRYPL